MPAPNTHKISSSSHKLYHEALKFASLYVYLSIGYGTLLTGAGLQVAGAPVGFLLGLQDAPLGKPAAEGGPAQGGWAQSGALSLATAGVMGVLIGLMVSRCNAAWTFAARLTNLPGMVHSFFSQLQPYISPLLFIAAQRVRPPQAPDLFRLFLGAPFCAQQ